MTTTTRQSERPPTQFDVVLHWSDTGGQNRTATFQARDLSGSGMAILGAVEIEAGTEVGVEGSAGGMTGTATVQYCRPTTDGFMLGLTFVKQSRPASPALTENVDYYEILQLSPKAEVETITRVYRIMAARFHPDNPETGDVEKFLALTAAFEVLSNPERRAAYDQGRSEDRPRAIPLFQGKAFIDDKEGEANRRLGVLCLLYAQRRRSPDHPSLSLLELEELMSYPREYLQFTLWYLKQKEYVERDQGSYVTLTAAGVDFVEQHTPTLSRSSNCCTAADATPPIALTNLSRF